MVSMKDEAKRIFGHFPNLDNVSRDDAQELWFRFDRISADHVPPPPISRTWSEAPASSATAK